MAATRLYCMIALILAGSAFLSLSMASSACRGSSPRPSAR